MVECETVLPQSAQQRHYIQLRGDFFVNHVQRLLVLFVWRALPITLAYEVWEDIEFPVWQRNLLLRCRCTLFHWIDFTALLFLMCLHRPSEELVGDDRTFLHGRKLCQEKYACKTRKVHQTTNIRKQFKQAVCTPIYLPFDSIDVHVETDKLIKVWKVIEETQIHFRYL